MTIDWAHFAPVPALIGRSNPPQADHWQLGFWCRLGLGWFLSGSGAGERRRRLWQGYRFCAGHVGGHDD